MSTISTSVEPTAIRFFLSGLNSMLDTGWPSATSSRMSSPRPSSPLPPSIAAGSQISTRPSALPVQSRPIGRLSQLSQESDWMVLPTLVQPTRSTFLLGSETSVQQRARAEWPWIRAGAAKWQGCQGCPQASLPAVSLQCLSSITRIKYPATVAMQSYEVHVVSELLKDRHPYLELPFRDREDPSQVRLAVQHWAVPKLLQILLMSPLDPHKHHDALRTLNQLVSHQETKCEMLSLGLFGVASAFLHSLHQTTREQAALLVGSLASVSRFRAFFEQTTEEGLKKMLLDPFRGAKQACGWALNRIVSTRVGVELLCGTSLVEAMIGSLLLHSEQWRAEEGVFVVYLLESLACVFQCDQGISFGLGKGLTRRLNQLLREQPCEEESFRQRINYLSLDCLGKLAQNPRGKEECIQERVIATARDFLSSDSALQQSHALTLIMFCAVSLQGKQQCIYDEEGVNRSMVQCLYVLLVSEDSTVKANCKEALRSIAQLKDGFLAITSELGSSNREYLQEIFGSQVVVALAELIPKPSSLQFPPIIEDFQNLPGYKELAKALSHFLLHSDDALQIALEESVQVVLRLVPYMIFKGDRELQSVVASAIVRLCGADSYSRSLVRAFIERYGRVQHPLTRATLSFQFQGVDALADIIKR